MIGVVGKFGSVGVFTRAAVAVVRRDGALSTLAGRQSGICSLREG